MGGSVASVVGSVSSSVGASVASVVGASVASVVGWVAGSVGTSASFLPHGRLPPLCPSMVLLSAPLVAVTPDSR